MDHQSITSSNSPELSPPNAAVLYMLRPEAREGVFFQSTPTGFSVRLHFGNCQMALEISSDSGSVKNIRVSSMSKTGFTGSEIARVIGYLRNLEESLNAN